MNNTNTISVAKERQLSFRTKPETKRLARIEAAKQGLALGEWLNKIVEENLPKQTN